MLWQDFVYPCFLSLSVLFVFVFVVVVELFWCVILFFCVEVNSSLVKLEEVAVR